MQKKLKILITGASRGMGNAITKKICHRADTLILTAKHTCTLDKSVEELRTIFSGNICCFNLDQANASIAAEELEKEIKNRVEYIDALILCAGDFIEGKMQEVAEKSFVENMNTNFNFNYYVVKRLIPLLKKAQKPKIIIIGSTAAYEAYSVPTYSITKWALRGYAKNLRKELMEEEIGVTFISPGATLTDMWSDVQLPPDRLLEPNDIAKIIDNLFDLSAQAVVEELIVRPMLGDIDE